MSLSYLVNKSHEIIKSLDNKNTAIDCTCGNGHDTLFLASLFKNVIAFDIQPLAIKRSKERLNSYPVAFYLDNYKKIDMYNFKNIDLIIYNLGFLPGSDKSVVTKKEDTIESISKALDILNRGGKILITAYLRHAGGLDEYMGIRAFLEENNIKANIYTDELTTDSLIEITK